MPKICYPCLELLKIMKAKNGAWLNVGHTPGTWPDKTLISNHRWVNPKIWNTKWKKSCPVITKGEGKWSWAYCAKKQTTVCKKLPDK